MDTSKNTFPIRWIVGACVLGCLLVIISIGLKHIGYGDASLRLPDDVEWESRPVPEVDFQTFAGESLPIASLRGKVVILNFWASWCGPCTEEFPLMLGIAEQFAGSVQIVAVSNDATRADADAFIEKMLPQGSPYVTWIWDESSRISIEKFAVMRFPETIIIDPAGNMVKKVVGVSAWHDPALREFIGSLL